MQLTDIRKLKRFKDIVAILAKYGFDELVQRLEMPGADYLRSIHPVDPQESFAVRFRKALVELGPTFVKFGQLLSLRPDLIPSDLTRELESLQDDVQPVDTELIIPILEEAYEKPLKKIFTVFDVEPIAAASMSQVYKAVLAESGDFVAVKVRRPEIEEDLVSDLQLLAAAATFLHEQFEDLRAYNFPELIDVVRTNAMREIDFTNERNNMRIARSFAADNTEVYIPKTYDQMCRPHILVMEFILAERFQEVVANYSLREREWIARLGLKTAAAQFLEDGFFHADPHPGNLLIMDDQRLCLIDWGLAGRLTEQDRFLLIEMLQAIAEKDSHALVAVLLRMSNTVKDTSSTGAMERDLLGLLDRFTAGESKLTDLGKMLMEMLALVGKHQLTLPTDYVVMIRALVIAEGSARQVYPELDVIAELGSYVHRLARRRYRPEKIWKTIRGSFVEFWLAQQDIPRRIEQFAAKAERGDLGLNLRLEKIERLMAVVESASNRLTAGIITGALIIGSSMIITTGVGPFLFGFPALGVIGYVLSVMLAVWILYTILRRK